jgi:hypothetical protein
MDNNQPKRSRRKAEPIPETQQVEETPTNKYAPKEKIGTATLGRSPNYVTAVGLGKLQVIHATSSNDNSNVQSE